MLNPRNLFLFVTLSFLFALIYDWTNLSKEEKLERSLYVQNSSNINPYRVIKNNFNFLIKFKKNDVEFVDELKSYLNVKS
jgi:hypothetical protein